MAANGSLHLRRFITAKCTQIPFRAIKSLKAVWFARREAEYPHKFYIDDYDIDLCGCMCVCMYLCVESLIIYDICYACRATTVNSENR